MAYGDWGAFVYKNGVRMESHEDNTPYKETELQAGYAQAFLRSEGMNPHHATLGDMDVRLCGYKNYPRLYLRGEQLDMTPFLIPSEAPEWEDQDWKGLIGGYDFTVTQYDDNMVDLYLKQPDGSVWNSTCGYCYGAGHID